MMVFYGTCFAEWMHVDRVEVKQADMFLDNGSVRTSTYDGCDIVKAEVKVVYDKTMIDGTKYQVYNVWINLDRKIFKIVRTDDYDITDKLINTSESSPNNQYWTRYPYQEWDKMLNTIIDMSKK